MLPTLLMIGFVVGLFIFMVMATTQTTIHDPVTLNTQTTRELDGGAGGKWEIFAKRYGNFITVVLSGSEVTDGGGLSPVINIPNVGPVVAAFFSATGATSAHLQHQIQAGDGDVQFLAKDLADVVIVGAVTYEAIVFVQPPP